MSQHTITVEEVRQLSDGQVAYRLRADGDAASDSWHTWDVAASLPAPLGTGANFAQWLAGRQQSVAVLYDNVQQYVATLHGPVTVNVTNGTASAPVAVPGLANVGP